MAQFFRYRFSLRVKMKVTQFKYSTVGQHGYGYYWHRYIINQTSCTATPYETLALRHLL